MRKRLPREILLEDLESAAVIGLWDAIDRGKASEYAGTKNLDFYLVKRIRGSILDEVRRQDWLPRYMHREIGAAVLLHFDQLSQSEADRALSVHTNAEEAVIAADMSRELKRAIEICVPPRYRAPLAQILGGAQVMEVAQACGISSARVSQIMRLCEREIRREFQRREFTRRHSPLR